MTHIYYIEDDPDIAAAVKEYLERKGFLITLCATLAQARQALEDHLPTLVLLGTVPYNRYCRPFPLAAGTVPYHP